MAREPRRNARWAAARAVNRALLLAAYGNSYLSEYRRFVGEFDRRPRTALNDIWVGAAEEVGASVRGDWGNGFEFRRGAVHARVDGWETHLDPPESVRRSLDKPLVAARLSELGIPVPEQFGFSLREAGGAFARVRQGGGPWVLKPRAGEGGMGVTCGVEKPADLARALVAAAPFGGEFVLERQFPGAVYRLLILDGELLDAVRRDPSAVEGDGTATVRDLMRGENRARVEAAGARGNQLVHPDQDSLLALRAQQIGLDSVPRAGRRWRVKNSNGDGGRFDTHQVPSSSISREMSEDAVRAVAALELRLAGVDVVTPDLGLGISAAGGAVLEVNAPPALHYHYLTTSPTNTRVATLVLQRLLGVD